MKRPKIKQADAPNASLSLDELRARLVIDKSDLDRELVHQAELFFHAGAGVALRTSRRDAAKDRLRHAQADAAARSMKRQTKAGARATVATASNEAESDPEVVAARSDVAKLTKAVEEWIALRDAFAQRGWMLRELCSLYRDRGQGWEGDTKPQARPTAQDYASKKQRD